MARGKKKETLTPEERLQAALVPKSEQPYKVPGNWCWTALKHISSHISDGSHNPPKDSGKGIPLLSATNIHDHLIDIDSAVRWITEEQWIIENQRTKIETKDVLLTIVASIGRTAVVKNEQFALQRSVAVIKPKINSEFLSYYFETPYIQQFMSDNAKGTAQKGFYLNSLAELFCCVPPLAEQQRVVDRIESLFAKLDEAKQKVQDALDSFETRKAAILHKAFIGELTAQWRKEHGVGMESWENKTLQQLSQKIGDGLHGTPVYSENGAYFFINGNNFSGLKIEIKPDTKRVDYSQYQKYKIELGDNTVLVSINGTLGKTALYKNELVVLGKSACYINVGEKLNKFFLRYFLESTEFLNYADKMATGSTIKNLGLKAMRNLMLKLPSVPEQTEIVRLLDDLIAKEQRAKEAAERVLGQIDLIKKAILARAFRGELGTNTPNEERAVELLKQVL